MQTKIEIIEPRLFAGSVADEIIASINEAVSERGSCSLVLSGGSTPAAVYRAMACPPRVEEADWGKLKVFWGDERWVPHSDNQSNFKMAQETLLSQLNEAKPQVFAVDTSLASAEKGAAAYSDTIKKAGLTQSAGYPVFDLVLLGMGEDGHTASIFPHSSVLSKPGQICAAVTHPSDGSVRITLTPDALFAARKILFIVSGNSKAETLRRVLNAQGDLETLPARLYERVADKVTWFLDSAAAKELAIAT